jgi:hypothetical protein
VSADFSSEPFDTSSWHPRARLLYAYWQTLERHGRRLPARAAFDPLDIVPALGWVWMHDIERAPFRLKCRLFGTLVAAAVGVDITGLYLQSRPLSSDQRPLDETRLRLTALDGVPTHARTPPLLKHGDIWQSVESLMLPLAADGQTPDILLGVSVYYRADGSVV